MVEFMVAGSRFLLVPIKYVYLHQSNYQIPLFSACCLTQKSLQIFMKEANNSPKKPCLVISEDHHVKHSHLHVTVGIHMI